MANCKNIESKPEIRILKKLPARFVIYESGTENSRKTKCTTDGYRLGMGNRINCTLSKLYYNLVASNFDFQWLQNLRFKMTYLC